MTNEIPSALSAYHPGVGHVCSDCGRVVVDAVETPGEEFRCVDCQVGAEGMPLPTAEDDLTRAALEDAPAQDTHDDAPTFWRLIVVIAFAVIALAIVFWKR
jgi:hypothetical protein